jgi:hypothetical protein
MLMGWLDFMFEVCFSSFSLKMAMWTSQSFRISSLFMPSLASSSSILAISSGSVPSRTLRNFSLTCSGGTPACSWRMASLICDFLSSDNLLFSS